MRYALLSLVLLGATIGVFSLPPIPQDKAYHNFADISAVLGVPHFADVCSNIIFLLAGMWGLNMSKNAGETAIYTEKERLIWQVFFVCVMWAGFGSAYYHLLPDNDRLFWDRLPISLSFAALFALVVSDFVSPSYVIKVFVVTAVYATGALLYWSYTEQQAAGDLRPYLLVQIIPILSIMVFLCAFSSSYTKSYYVFMVLLLYILAKVAEYYDDGIYHLSGSAVSGHTLKHVVSGVAVMVLVEYIKKRNKKSDR